jgi:hypothetical protein
MSANEKNLGQLESVELREVWESESGDFTPWLAKEENLALLGDAIGVELELEAQEKGVGSFRADMLCKDTATNDWVVIENQLAWTDHCHLGQLLTYAAGLGAKTIVWIAGEFTDEHRAALDWLNGVVGGRLSVFGIEVELWRIGDSAVAPKFNVVSRPNVSVEVARESAEGTMSDTQLLRRDYWTRLQDMLLERKSIVVSRNPRPVKWATFKIGRSGFRLYTGMDPKEGTIEAGISSDYELNRLKDEKDVIEREIGFPLIWGDGDGDDEFYWIGSLRDDVDPANRGDWASQHLWMAEKLEALYKAFAPRVRELDLEEQQPDDE